VRSCLFIRVRRGFGLDLILDKLVMELFHPNAPSIQPGLGLVLQAWKATLGPPKKQSDP
jgi:hypothetical protein